MDDKNSDVTDCTCSCNCHLKHNEGAEQGVPGSNIKVPDDHVREYPCKNGCGMMIRFDNNKVSESRKKIPLDPDGTPHTCSKAPPIKCKLCASEITFQRTPSGKWTPLNADRSFHECPKWSPNKSELDEQQDSKEEEDLASDHRPNHEEGTVTT